MVFFCSMHIFICARKPRGGPALLAFFVTYILLLLEGNLFHDLTVATVSIAPIDSAS